MSRFTPGWVLCIDATECTPELYVVVREFQTSGFSTKTCREYSTTTSTDEATVFHSGQSLRLAESAFAHHRPGCHLRIKHCCIERSVKIGHYATTDQEVDNAGTD